MLIYVQYNNVIYFFSSMNINQLATAGSMAGHFPYPQRRHPQAIAAGREQIAPQPPHPAKIHWGISMVSSKTIGK